MLPLILFFTFLDLFHSKNLCFPFKKLTIEYLNKTKSIADFIDFNIYTNISMGTPKKLVAHFITKDDQLFYYNKLKIHSHYNKEFEDIQNKIENSINIYYTPIDSSSFETIDNYFQVFSDEYLLYDLNKTKKETNLNFNMYPSDEKEKLYGNIALYFMKADPYDEYNKYIFKMLKERELINETYFTFIYGEYDSKLGSNYLNDNYNDILGNLILGESPHEFIPNKCKKEDEIKINGRFKLEINEIKLDSKISNYSEENVRISISFTSALIMGSLIYKNETDNIFFNDLISKNICRIDYVYENIYMSQDIIYSCENNNIMKEKIKNFPTLYFIIKPCNLTFLFNYKELFQLHNNRLYFLIYYRAGSYSNWEVGELFLRKYITSFNYYSKTISFYKNQVDDINNITYKIVPDEEPDEIPDSDPTPAESNNEPKNKMKTWIIIVILCGIILVLAVIIIVLLIFRAKKFRKKRADELIDDNYEYTSENNIN